jgi:catechol 2,3-dioxygenase-like lactoylglutathione lyase family enzyme
MIPTLTGSRLVLAVQDLQQSAAFYKDQLGFNTVWEGGGWHFLSRDQVCIMIGECPDDLPAFELGSHSYVAYFEVKNIDGLYREYLLKEVEILSGLQDKPWGQREFSIRTIDGHRINFGEAIISNLQ